MHDPTDLCPGTNIYRGATVETRSGERGTVTGWSKTTTRDGTETYRIGVRCAYPSGESCVSYYAECWQLVSEPAAPAGAPEPSDPAPAGAPAGECYACGAAVSPNSKICAECYGGGRAHLDDLTRPFLEALEAGAPEPAAPAGAPEPAAPAGAPEPSDPAPAGAPEPSDPAPEILGQLSTTALISLRVNMALSGAAYDPGLRTLIDAELAKRYPALAPAPARALAPQLPPLAARPFSQLARRSHRLGLDVPRGYLTGLSGAAWYRRRRRRPAVAAARPVLRAAARRRANRAYWRARPLYLCPVAGELVAGLADPFVVYGSCEVA